jgi:hypothetical protein
MHQDPHADEETKQSALPPRDLKHGYLFNPNKSENIVREVLKEYDPMFNSAYLEIMCQVFISYSRNLD